MVEKGINNTNLRTDVNAGLMSIESEILVLRKRHTEDKIQDSVSHFPLARARAVY